MAVNLTTYVKRADFHDVFISANDPLAVASLSTIGFASFGISGNYVIHTSDDNENDVKKIS